MPQSEHSVCVVTCPTPVCAGTQCVHTTLFLASDCYLLSVSTVCFLFHHREERGTFIRKKYVDKEFTGSEGISEGQRITSDV